MTPQRHHLIYVEPDACCSIHSCHADKSVIEYQVRNWLHRGLPCIYAKQEPGDKKISLGLPLLLENKKYRIALHVAPSLVVSHQPLPQLMEMKDFFLQYYGIKVEQFSNISVYGSFLFHYLSQQTFVTETSDLDLLIEYQGYSLHYLNQLVITLAKKFNRSIDGEVRFDSLGDVAIKELLDLSASQLLCKSKDKLVLLSRTELYQQYPLL